MRTIPAKTGNGTLWGKCCKTFYARNLRVLVISCNCVFQWTWHTWVQYRVTDRFINNIPVFESTGELRHELNLQNDVAEGPGDAQDVIPVKVNLICNVKIMVIIIKQVPSFKSSLLLKNYLQDTQTLHLN